MNSYTEHHRAGRDDHRPSAPTPGRSSPPELVWENEGGRLLLGPHDTAPDQTYDPLLGQGDRIRRPGTV